MGESDLHKLLKKVGMAWLYNQQCYMVADEVFVWKDRDTEPHKLDNHYFVDVVGAGKKYRPYFERERGGEYGYYDNILRGIEVKISRNDFKSGFVTTGCNYHYLLTPMRLVNRAELPSWCGLLEYDQHKFDVSYLETGKFHITGLKIVKKPRFRTITDRQFKKGVSSIWQRLSVLVKSNLVELLCQTSNEKGDSE